MAVPDLDAIAALGDAGFQTVELLQPITGAIETVDGAVERTDIAARRDTIQAERTHLELAVEHRARRIVSETSSMCEVTVGQTVNHPASRNMPPKLAT